MFALSPGSVALRRLYFKVVCRVLTTLSNIYHFLFYRWCLRSDGVPSRVTPLDQVLISFKMKSREWRMPDLCAFVSHRYGSIANLCLFERRLFVVTDRELAHRLISQNGGLFIQRFGLNSGLERIGMREKGLIWNNAWHWGRNRRVFERTISQGVTMLPQAVDDYFSSGSSIDIPTCRPISLLGVLRDLTLTLTLKTLFCIPTIPPHEWKEQTIAIVGKYFKAWEFYLLNPETNLFPELDKHHRMSVGRMHSLGREILRMTKDCPTDSFVARLSQHYDENTVDGETELVQNICEMLLAGTDTSSLTLFYTLCFIADYGCQGVNIDHLVFEVMRLLPVGPVIIRQATDDVAINEELTVHKGDGVVINVAGINLSSVEYDQPLEFIPERYSSMKVRLPISFGEGIKSCVGSGFAKKEMSLVLDYLLNKFTILSRLPSASSALLTRWDIANTPSNDIPLYLFPKNKIVYLVGQSSTGKTTIASLFQKHFPRMVVRSEVARNIMEQEGWSRSHLSNDDTFLALQRLIVKAHKKLLSDEDRNFAIVDRSLIDALFFCRQRFGRANIAREIELEILNACAAMKPKAIIIHFPYEPTFTHDDGIRIMPSSELEELLLHCLDEVQIKYHTLKSLGKEDRLEEILRVISDESE